MFIQKCKNFIRAVWPGSVLHEPVVPNCTLLFRTWNKIIQQHEPVVGSIDILGEEYWTDYAFSTNRAPSSYPLRFHSSRLNDPRIVPGPEPIVLFVDTTREPEISLVRKPDLFGIDRPTQEPIDCGSCEFKAPLSIIISQVLINLYLIRIQLDLCLQNLL